jgi:hypothetical protein
MVQKKGYESLLTALSAVLGGRLIALAVMIIGTLQGPGASEPRSPFAIPLANLSYTAAHDTVAENIMIWFDKVDEWWEIRRDQLKHVKEREMNSDEEFYRKPSGPQFLLSTVEASVISRICKTFSKTLETFDRDLKNSRWDRCLYLDSYLASFCHQFYHLMVMCRASESALPRITDVADSLFDRSPESPKSDARIATWRKATDHVIKLRIAAQELMYQIKKWQKSELDDPSNSSWEDESAGFNQAYELFVKLYFNLAP